MKRNVLYGLVIFGATAHAQVVIQNTSSNSGVVNLGGGNVGSVTIDGKTMSGNGAGVMGSGQTATRQRTVEPFSRVTVEIAGNVRITMGPEPRINVQADSNVVDLISMKVSNSTLTIAASEPFTAKVPIQIEIAAPTIAAVTLAGAGSIDLSGISGRNLELTLGGSGDIKAKGSIDDLVARIGGSGNLSLGELAARKGRVAIDGVGDAEVFVKEELIAEISGTGEIVYRGSPRVSTKISGVGDVAAAADRE